MTVRANIRDFLRPLHRAFASRLPLRARRQYLYLAAQRRFGDFRNPRTFNEKVNWRIINDRRPQIADASDKLTMKDMARARLPEEQLRIPETLWVGTDVTQIPAELLAQDVVIKPNHGSGDVIFGPVDPADLPRLTEGWLRPSQDTLLGEWGYAQARALIVVERTIADPHQLVDYKVLTFGGEPRALQVHRGRHGERHTRTYYDVDWNRLPVRTAHQEPDDVPRPENLADLLAVARELSRGWDFLRVDLYSVNGEVWLGEYSPYPCGGVARFLPRSFDAYMGSLWTLPHEVRKPTGGTGVSPRAAVGPFGRRGIFNKPVSLTATCEPSDS